MATPLQLVQGLLFIVEEHRSTSEDQSSASRPAIAYILLPRNFLIGHPNVAIFLEEKLVPILNGENVSHLFPHVEKLRVFEIFLDGSPEEYVDPPCIYASYSCSNEIHLLLGTYPWSMYLVVENKRYERSAVDDVSLKIIEQLLVLSPDIPCKFVSQSNECSGNLLHLAAMSGQVRFVSSLLDHGANICSVCNLEYNIYRGGYTPLHMAVMGGSASAVKLIVERGADVNAKDGELRIPLHYAEQLDVIEILLENGANVNLVDKYKCPPLLEFIRNTKKIGNWARVSQGLILFLKYGAIIDTEYKKNSCSCLYWALFSRNVQVFQFILESFLVASSVLNDIPLHEAVKDCSAPHNRNCFFRHLVKVVTLLQLPDPNNVVASLWTDETTNPDDFRRECELEITRLKSEIIPNTTTSLFDVLSCNEYKLCGLLRNEDIARGLNALEPTDQFHKYGNIFLYRLDKSKNRKLFQECGGKSLDLFSLRFKELPDFIKDRILGYLNIADLLNLKRAKSQLTT